MVGSEPEEMSTGVQMDWERRESDPGVLRKRDDYHEDAVQTSAATLMRPLSIIIILYAGKCIVSGHSPYSYWHARLLEPGR